LARTLKAAGIPVVAEISDSAQFLSSLEGDKPNVAILDLGELNAEGLTLLREAHQFHPEIHLLVLLGGVDPASVERCIQAGAAGYLDKYAVGCDAVIEAVKALSRGDRVFPALFLEAFVRTRSSPSAAPGILQSLSGRERQVLAHIAAGSDNARIALALDISERTVKAHVSSLYRKLGQKNRTQLALHARQLGIRPPPEQSAEQPGGA
jgi:two-component system, NarL family, nitrate/nitrite response regulator NarL